MGKVVHFPRDLNGLGHVISVWLIEVRLSWAGGEKHDRQARATLRHSQTHSPGQKSTASAQPCRSNVPGPL